MRALVVAYGIAVAVAGGIHFDRVVSPVAIERHTLGDRRGPLRDSYELERRGGPPLAASIPGEPRRLRALPKADFFGWYVFLPALARAADTRPYVAAKWLFVVAWALLLLALPLVFYELTGSLAAALAVPLLALWRFGFVANADYYWVSAWAALFCLPPLLVLAKAGRRIRLELVVGVLLVASVADSIRFSAGLPAYAAALVLIGMRARPWRYAAVAALVATVAYLSISVGAMHGVKAERDRAVASTGQTLTPQLTRSFWHTAYIGLGYLPNRYGIGYLDAVGKGTAKRVDPGARPYEPGYDGALRSAFLHVWRADPGLVAANVLQKTRATVLDAIDRFSAVFLLVPLLGLVGRLRGDYRRWLAMLAPAVPITLLAPVLAVPVPAYWHGWLGVTGLLLLLCVAGGIALVADAIRSRRRPTAEVRLAWAIPAALVVAALAGAAAASPDHGRDYTVQEPLVPRPPTLAGETIRLPLTRAQAVPSASVERAGPFELTTDRARAGYELLFPARRMPAGQWAVLVRGEILRGGLIVGALDVDGGPRWLATARYWYAEPGRRHRPMSLRFDLDRPKRVRIVLSNWGLLDDPRSRWRIRDVVLGRAAGAG